VRPARYLGSVAGGWVPMDRVSAARWPPHNVFDLNSYETAWLARRPARAAAPAGTGRGRSTRHHKGIALWSSSQSRYHSTMSRRSTAATALMAIGVWLEACGGDSSSSASLTVSVSGTGTGFVTSQPPGIACPPSCTAEFTAGTHVLLTAESGSAATFAAWDGACVASGDEPTCALDIVAGAQPAAGASFVLGAPLVVGVEGGGTVVSEPAGISCPGRCSHVFSPGTQVVLRTQLALGVGIHGWTDACAGSGQTCTLLMDRSRQTTLQLDGAGAVRRFARSFAGASSQEPLAVLAYPDGGLIFAGRHNLQTSFGDVELLTPGAYVARYDSAGTRIWLAPIDIGGIGTLTAVRVLSGGDVAVAGSFLGTADLGEGPVTAIERAAFLVVLDGVTGFPRWSVVADGPQNDGATAVVEHGGELILGGSFVVAADFGAGIVFAQGSEPSGFLARYNIGDGAPAGVDLPPGQAQILSLEHLGTDLLVSAAAATSTQWGTAALPAGVVLVRRDGPTGTVRWARSLGNANTHLAWRFLEAGDTVLLATAHQTEWTLDGVVIVPEGPVDGAVLAVSSETGATRWLTRLRGPGYAIPSGLTVRGDQLLAVGWFTQVLDAGALSLESSEGNAAGFVMKVDPTDGAPTGPGMATASVALQLTNVAILDDGAVAVTGSFSGLAGSGVGPLPFSSDDDAFLVVFEPLP